MKIPNCLAKMSHNRRFAQFSILTDLKLLHLLNSLLSSVSHLHLFFLNLKLFNWRLITLQYCIGSATHQHESATGVYMFPILTPVPHPSPYHPSRSSQCTSPKDPVSNLDWRFISYMILYMFPWHSPKSSHPLPLPQSPKDCSIHLCLFCCLTYRVIITIFLNSTYMR